MAARQADGEALSLRAVCDVPRGGDQGFLGEAEEVGELRVAFGTFDFGRGVFRPGQDAAVFAVLVPRVFGEMAAPEHAGRGGEVLWRQSGGVARCRGSLDMAGPPTGVDKVPVVWSELYGVPRVVTLVGRRGA